MKKTKQRAVALTIALLLFLSVFTIGGATISAGGQPGWNQDSGNWYYYVDGHRHIGWLKDNGVWYYLDPEYGGALHHNGFIKIDEYWYYMVASGRTVQNGWHKITGGNWDGRWIKAYPSGVLITGWMKEGGSWYHLSPTMHEEGYNSIGEDNWYYFNKDGTLYTKEGWFQGMVWSNLPHLKYWFYANKGGLLKTGWFKYYNKWYYLDPYTFIDSVQEIDGKFYYFDENGICATQAGWIKHRDYWYYRQNGGSLKTGWFKYYNKWFYLIPDMLTGSSHWIDGRLYNFDENGVWIP